MNNKVFISGKITEDPNYREKFAEAADDIRHPYFWEEYTTAKYAMRHGRLMRFEPVNPTEFTFLGREMDFWPWAVCMAVCLWHLVGCSHVYMLRDWRDSRGAKIENRTAKLLRKHIIYQ